MQRCNEPGKGKLYGKVSWPSIEWSFYHTLSKTALLLVESVKLMTKYRPREIRICACVDACEDMLIDGVEQFFLTSHFQQSQSSNYGPLSTRKGMHTSIYSKEYVIAYMFIAQNAKTACNLGGR